MDTKPSFESLQSKMDKAGKPARAALLIDFLNRQGHGHFEEEVTQYAHAAQSAWWARKNEASPELVAAALLHDIGHMLTGETDDYTETDREHELVAADFLSPYFPAAVTEPIRLHVPAKRYIVSTEPDYYEKLSEASKHSFHLQGGYMTPEEKSAFEALPHYLEAIALRYWDDLAKDTQLEAPPIESYLPDLEAALV